MTTLYEHLDQVLAPEDADSDRFTVTDERSADWVARRVQHHHRAIAEKRAERDEIVAAADDWLARETKAHADSAEYLEGLLGDWLRGEIEADPKGKVSRKLPCGATVRRITGRPSVDVVDLDVFRDFAEANGRTDLLRIKIDPDKRVLSKLPVAGETIATEDGEAIPGVRVVVAPDSFKVDPGGGA